MALVESAVVLCVTLSGDRNSSMGNKLVYLLVQRNRACFGCPGSHTLTVLPLPENDPADSTVKLVKPAGSSGNYDGVCVSRLTSTIANVLSRKPGTMA